MIALRLLYNILRFYRPVCLLCCYRWLKSSISLSLLLAAFVHVRNYLYMFFWSMMASSNGNKWKHFLRYWRFERGIHRSPVNSPHKGQWRGALMLSLIWAWINRWVNNRKAGDLRRYRAHYDVIVMRCHWIAWKINMFLKFIIKRTSFNPRSVFAIDRYPSQMLSTLHISWFNATSYFLELDNDKPRT